MNVLDLFSGIGGFSLGLERAGMRTVAFCEIDPFCRRVLARHWPEVPIFEDVRSVRGSKDGRVGYNDPYPFLRTRIVEQPIDVICGGFPCQDISLVGKGAGLAGERSGLWREYARIVGELRPRHVIVENVAALLGRGLDTVLGDLAALGYDAEWHCIPASAVGAPHRRDRLWIVAHTTKQPKRKQAEAGNAITSGRQARDEPRGSSESVADADRKPIFGPAITWPERHPWDVEPALGRVVDGVSHRMVEDELRALGNAVVPQIPEIIGRAIMRNLAETISAHA